MPGSPKLLRYSSGYFKLYTANLPQSIQNDNEVQTRLLTLLFNKYANYSWGSMLPEERFNEMNDYLYSLVKDYK